MRNYVESVKDFHEKYGFTVGKVQLADARLLLVADQLTNIAKAVRQDTDAAVRAHLIVEEVAELLTAFTVGDSVATLDALADLLYVTLGTAVAFGLPIAEAFEEVHRSNMTKTVERDRPGHPGKGRDYSPPDLASLLEKRGR